MSQPKKRFGRSRNAPDETQQFTLTERDRELAALAAEILPRNSAAASFERTATRNAGSTSVAARDAVTDTAPAEDTTELDDAPETAGAPDAQSASRKKRGRAARAAGTASSSSAAEHDAAAPAPAGEATSPADAPEETPAQTKARIKARRDAERREAKAAKAEARARRADDYRPTPLWFKVIMIGLMILGLLWIITYYLFQGVVPIPGIGVWNLVIGLGFMLSGLIMTTQWR